MRLFITSDNHLGHAEADPVRGSDSFTTFEEALKHACASHADALIQGGDLFDENRPSRNTYNRAVRLLRAYCLGDTPCGAPLHADRPMNWDAPGQRIALPVFSIHGNHDDPSGFGSVSPHDILASAGLVNYFGRCDTPEDIVITPILLECGNERIALYGLGYVQGRVLHRAVARQRLRLSRPAGDNWFSILVVHQNRVPREADYLPEDALPDFLDLVIYGHEHDSAVVRHRSFDIIQCGSTVRTSLCEGECGPKYAYIVDVVGGRATIQCVPLRTVRPLALGSLRVAGAGAERAVAAEIDRLLRRGASEAAAGAAEAVACPENEGDCAPLLPLLRLRVEVEGDDSLQRHKLTESLLTRVANPGTALRILRRSVRRTAAPRPSLTTPRDITDIYPTLLAGADLATITASAANDALRRFLAGSDKDAFAALARTSIARIVAHINKADAILEDIPALVRRAAQSIEQNVVDSRRASEARGTTKNQSEEISDVTDVAEERVPQKEPSLVSADSLVSQEFTFIEERRAQAEDKMLLDQLKAEQCAQVLQTANTHPQPTETRENGRERAPSREDISFTDSDDLLKFSKYL